MDEIFEAVIGSFLRGISDVFTDRIANRLGIEKYGNAWVVLSIVVVIGVIGLIFGSCYLSFVLLRALI